MLFSVIVPIYNAEWYIKKCIQSVLDQSCRDFELILVVDGATDGSYEICKDFAEKEECIILINKPN